MKIVSPSVPRAFTVGKDQAVTLYDCGRVALAPDEQVTFTTERGGEYDVTRKSWGFYATPSLNHRLPEHRLRPVLVKNSVDRYFVLLVERGSEAQFTAYCQSEALTLVGWLDDEATLRSIAAALP